MDNDLLFFHPLSDIPGKRRPCRRSSLLFYTVARVKIGHKNYSAHNQGIPENKTSAQTGPIVILDVVDWVFLRLYLSIVRKLNSADRLETLGSEAQKFCRGGDLQFIKYPITVFL